MPFKTNRTDLKLLIMLFLILHCFCYSALAQDVTRLTLNQGTDLAPAWDPRGVTIAYLRNKSVGSQVYDAYKVESSGQAGEQVMLSGLNTDFGTAVNLSWIGSTGFLAVEEAISGFEVLKFNTALAPFDRTTANGADSANDLLLSINGGGGGGIAKISRDGNFALIRFSTSGSGGLVSIRSGPVADMVGQVSSSFGNVILSLNAGADSPFLNGGAISPDGSQYVLPTPTGSSATPHDLILGSTTTGSLTVNLTNDAASGFFNIYPDFSPDGTKIVFSRKGRDVNDAYDLYIINIDGTGLTQLTNTPNFSETFPSWSPDGGSVAFTGTHSAGHESEFPALEAGETTNANIYIMTLPAASASIVTPKTKLSDPPTVTVTNKNAKFIFAPFSKAQKSAAKSAKAVIEPAKKPKVTYTFRYELVLKKTDGPKRNTKTLFSKRNTLTAKKLTPGGYSAKYRVEIMKKEGSKTSLAGRTKFSPTATFAVGE